MDKIVAMIMGLSSNEADLKTLKQNLQKSEEVMYKSQHLDDALSQLDNVLYSMGVTFILYAPPRPAPRRSPDPRPGAPRPRMPASPSPLASWRSARAS